MRNKSKEEIKAEVEPGGPTLKCPNCPNETPSNFEFCEDVVAYRAVGGFNDNGQLLVSGMSNAGDDGDNERFVCNECGDVFPVPDSISIEWD